MKVVPQNTLVELAQVPERISTTAWKLPVKASVCVVPPAVKLYQTSLAVVAKPQLVVAGSDCVAPDTVPATGAVHAVVTGSTTALAQLSFTSGAGVVAHTAMVPLFWLPNDHTRMYNTSPGVRPVKFSNDFRLPAPSSSQPSSTKLPQVPEYMLIPVSPTSVPVLAVTVCTVTLPLAGTVTENHKSRPW